VLLVLLASLALMGIARANDNFPPGTVLAGSSGTVTGTTVGATGQASENATYGGANLNTIWYSWTAPANGVFTAATCNLGAETTTSHDTTLIAYTGAAFPLTVVSTNDDATGCAVVGGAGLGSVVTFNATAGTTYRLQVDGYASLTGTFVLRYGLVGLITNVTDNTATEGGDTATFTVVLRSPPAAAPPGGNNMAAQSATVTIGTSPQCTFAPASLTFSSANWNVPQTVTATAIDDAIVEGVHSCAPASITAATGAYAGVTTPPPTITVNDNENPNFTITKTTPTAAISAPGTITYTITVDNTGNALLTAPVITDVFKLGVTTIPLTSGPTLTSGDTNSNGQIEDPETWVYTATYAVTQADIDTGGTFTNTVTFSTTQVPAKTASANTNIVQSPNFTIAKTQASGPSPITAAGQTIGYSITVANTGNITLTTPVLADTFKYGATTTPLTTGPTLTSGDTNSNGKIDVGETWIYGATYVVTQANIDGTSSFTNVATMTTTQVATKTSNTVTTNCTRTPTLSLVKTGVFLAPGDDANGNGMADKNDKITYSFIVTNTGNVTISNVAVNDIFSGTGPPPSTNGEIITGDISPANDSTDVTGNNSIWSSLAPGDTVTFKGTYIVTQGDVDNG
jgi:uncharacterized repeat protein (TIGR01451 family)